MILAPDTNIQTYLLTYSLAMSGTMHSCVQAKNDDHKHDVLFINSNNFKNQKNRCCRYAVLHA